MKKILLVLLSVTTLTAGATIHNVEVGGNQQITPFFLPQNLNILEGDEIIWTWVSGQHNLETTSAPDPFDSGSHTAPFTWSKIFTVPGTYDYECSLFNHASTQFGTIIVGTNNVQEIQPRLSVEFTLFPNPANDFVTLEKTCICQTDIHIYDLTGKMILSFNNVADLTKRIDINALTSGIYFVELNANGNISRKRLIVK